MSRHKRPLEASTSTRSGGGGGQRHSKRPAPSTSNLQNYEINGSPGHFPLDDIIRQVVREVSREQANSIQIEFSHIRNELKGLATQIDSLKNDFQQRVLAFERVLKGMDCADLHSSKLVERTLLENTQITDTRNMQLRFISKLSLSVYTTKPLQKQLESPIQVELIDANTGRVITSGPESCAKLDVVVLRGDFNKEDNNTWSVKEFEEWVVKEREGKPPLLTGKLQVKLKEGIGELEDLTFTDNSSWTPSKTFRIALKVASSFSEGIRVLEAITEAFRVKEYRGKAYKKHDEPALDDEIWRLKKIGKDGKYCKRLDEEGIVRVEDFVRYLNGDSMKLRRILKGMPDEKWNVLKKHAYKCVSDGKSYVYYSEDKKDFGVVISNLCQLKGFITDRVNLTTDQLSHNQKAHAEELVKAAIKNWNHVEEFRAEPFSGPVPSKSLPAYPGELPINQQPCDEPSDHRLTPLSFPRIESSEAPPRSSVLVPGGLTKGSPNANHNYSVGISSQSLIVQHDTNLTGTVVLEQDVGPWNQHQTFPNEFGELVKSPSPCFIEDMLLSPAINHFESILFEDGDMFDNPGIGSSSDPRFGTKGIGRGVVGWLKLKAIFMWGGFIKKSVPERFVELD